MVRCLCLIYVLLLTTLSVHADEPRWHYTLSNDSAIQPEDGEVQKFRNVFAPVLDWNLNTAWRLHAEARLLRDPQFEGWERESALREFTLDWEGKETSIRLGLQQVVWGQASGFLSSFDIFHPQDRREWVLPAFEFLRRPLWMIQVQQPIGDWMLEALWSPEEKVNRTADPGETFYIPSVPPPPGLSIVDGGKKRDHQRLGLRLSTSYEAWDLALIYMYVPRNSAVFAYKPLPDNQLKRTTRYQSYDVAGLSFSYALESAVLRGEMSYYSDRDVQTTGVPGVTQSDQVNAVLGLDMTVLTDLDITLEAGHYQLFDYKDDFIESEKTTRVLFQIRKPFRHDTLIPRLTVVSDLRQGDLLIRPAVQWNMSDQLIITTGFDIISGDGQPFRQFGEADRGYVIFEYRQ